MSAPEKPLRQLRSFMDRPIGVVVALVAVLAIGIPVAWIAVQLDEVVEEDATVDLDVPGVTLAVRTGEGPTALAVSRGVLWVLSSAEEMLTAIDPDGEVDRHPVGVAVTELAIGEDAVWVGGTDPVAIIRLEPGASVLTGDRITRHGLPGRPAGLLWATELVWVTTDDGALLRLDPDGFEADRTDDFDPGAPGRRPMAVGEGAVWVASPNGRVLGLDPGTGRPVSAIETGGTPSNLAFHGDHLWLVDGARLISVDPRAGVVVSTVEVDLALGDLASAGTTLWVTAPDAGLLIEVDPAAGTVTGTAPIGGKPTALALQGDHIWIALEEEGVVARFDVGALAAQFRRNGG